MQNATALKKRPGFLIPLQSQDLRLAECQGALTSRCPLSLGRSVLGCLNDNPAALTLSWRI